MGAPLDFYVPFRLRETESVSKWMQNLFSNQSCFAFPRCECTLKLK